MKTGLETKTAEQYQAAAITEVQEAYPKYFEALAQHPRMLVGQQVPAIGKEGMETLRDAADAKDWQDAIRHLLADEVRGRVSKAMDASRGNMDTLTQSIELFEKNPDLVPHTKEFDADLADRLVKFATPYAVKNEAGKLIGYSIPVQPIIDQLRDALATERAARAHG